LEWRLQVEEAWKIVAWLTCLSSFLQPDKKKLKNKLSKREQTEPEHHKKPRTLFVASPK